MAQMAVAVGAQHLDAVHAQRVVGPKNDRVGVGRIEERRPTAMGFELLAAAEQLGAAGAALVDTLGRGVGVLAGEWPLGAGAAEDREFVRRELLAPLVVGELHLGGWGRHDFTLAVFGAAHPLLGVGERRAPASENPRSS